MKILRFLKSTNRAVRAQLHLWLGRFWLMTGKKARAEKEFREVLSHLGEDFRASLYLGRLALEAGDLPGALREMSAARRHSPARFARLHGICEESMGEEGLRDARIREETACDEEGRLTEAGSQSRPGRSCGGSQPLPQFYYWHSTPDSFDFEPERAAIDGEDDLFRDGHDEDSPWTDFLGHHYFFDSLSQGLPMGHSPGDEPSGEGDEENLSDEDFDAFGEEAFDFLSEDENEALSPWSEVFSSEGYQMEEDLAEKDQNCRSPLAGFYEELEEARKQADDSSQDPHGQDPHGQDPHGHPDPIADHARFQGLPPIQGSELEAVDWDDLLGRLTEENGDLS